MGRSARKQGLYGAPVVWLSARTVAEPRFGRRDDNSGMGVLAGIGLDVRTWRCGRRNHTAG